jgi:MoaA/NifB/PqqE/SkfB family radical SAM enzyme
MQQALPTMPRPTMVNLESTLGCNLECIMCGSHLSGVTKKRRVMPEALIERVREQVLPGVRDLSLTVAGEPLMTPKLSTFLALAEEMGAELQLNSNATLIKDDALIRRVLQSSSVLKFSLDAPTARTYESIRVGSDFEKVTGNIRQVVRIRQELPRDRRPRLAICMILMRRNIDELVEMVELVHALGVDRLELAHLTVFDPELDAESLRHHAQRSDRMIRAARSRADSLGLRLHTPPAMDGSENGPSGRARARLALGELRNCSGARIKRLRSRLHQKIRQWAWARKAGGQVPCHFLQSGVFISIGGDVAPCPMPGRPVAGNLLEQDFDTIWNGPVLTSMRRGLMKGSPHDCCAHCSQNPAVYDPLDDQTLNPGDAALPEALLPS